jgi:hypothetical protein
MPPHTYWGSILTVKDFRSKINLLIIGDSRFSGEGYPFEAMYGLERHITQYSGSLGPGNIRH